MVSAHVSYVGDRGIASPLRRAVLTIIVPNFSARRRHVLVSAWRVRLRSHSG